MKSAAELQDQGIAGHRPRATGPAANVPRHAPDEGRNKPTGTPVGPGSAGFLSFQSLADNSVRVAAQRAQFPHQFRSAAGRSRSMAANILSLAGWRATNRSGVTRPPATVHSNTVQCETDLPVQQGPSCWLFVLEALAKSKGIGTKYISMVMKSYPDSPEAVAKQKEEEASGRSISKRAAALEVIVENITEMMAKLHNWKIGAGGGRAHNQISKKIVERYAKQTLGTDRSVEHLAFAPIGLTANVDGVIQEYAKAKTRASTLASITIQDSDDVGSLLNTGPQIIDSTQSPDDVHSALMVQDKPSYVSIRARFAPTKDELGNDSGTVDLSARPLNELKETAHAILLEQYDKHSRIVTYKDPNYGNIKFKVTHVQFQAMAGEGIVKLRPFFKSGMQKSKLADVAD